MNYDKAPFPWFGGQGVNHAGLREQGVSRRLPHLTSNGRGVNRPQLRETTPEMTMPRFTEWMQHLAARLRHVRILCGDWRRAVTSGAAKTLPVRQGAGPAGIFLDPPYADTAERSADLYGSHDSMTVAHDVRAWCLEHGDDPQLRIVLAGFDGEHGTEMIDAGWTAVEWFKAGFLTGGMGNNKGAGGQHQQHRERLWCSPHCLAASKQGSLFV